MKAEEKQSRKLAWGALGRPSLAAVCGLAGLLAAGSVLADSKDGVFPTAEQVGGDVFPKGIGIGQKFPTDFDVYDENGNKVDLSRLISGKRSVIAFFISGAPASINEVKKLEQFVKTNEPGVQVFSIHADTVGTALEGGPSKALQATIRTAKLVHKEHGLMNAVYVAPNDALSPKAISNRLGFRGLPTVFVLKADGTVEKVFVGAQNWKKGDI